MTSLIYVHRRSRQKRMLTFKFHISFSKNVKIKVKISIFLRFSLIYATPTINCSYTSFLSSTTILIYDILRFIIVVKPLSNLDSVVSIQYNFYYISEQNCTFDCNCFKRLPIALPIFVYRISITVMRRDLGSILTDVFSLLFGQPKQADQTLFTWVNDH